MSSSFPGTVFMNTAFPVLEQEPRALYMPECTLLLSYVSSLPPIKKIYFIFNCTHVCWGA